MITRIAPTPSGYLHPGNCVNFLLVWWAAQAESGSLALRIDDMDADRYRPEYVDDAFRVLRWLGIEWDVGPRDRLDFETSFALRERTEVYRSELSGLRDSMIETYACECSRNVLREAGSLVCVSRCRDRGVSLEPGRSALRVSVPTGAQVVVGSHEIDLAVEMGDFVIWRRDDRPSYQLASVVEDRNLGTSVIVRGEDLLASSAAQVLLAPYLRAPNVAGARYVHHSLVVDESGSKLSKSQLSTGPMPETDELFEAITTQAVALGSQVGISPP